MSHSWSRRDVLKTLGMSLGASAIPVSAGPLPAPAGPPTEPIALRRDTRHPDPKRPVTAITLGAGNRGRLYGRYATQYSAQLKIVGVAEPIEVRREYYRRTHGLADDRCFTTWEQVFARPKFADAVIISTPDQLHYEPCLAALEAGYDILLEKPIAPTEAECRAILAKVNSTGRIVAVCHVLRYAPYFTQLRDMIQRRVIGEVVSVQHFEPIEHIHFAHSFVRGPWHNSRTSTPIVLAKSCHDLDILRWLVDRPCQSVQAFGHLSWFRSENVPDGSTERCTDGCSVEATCPFSAPHIYGRLRRHLGHLDLPESPAQQKSALRERLRTTDYGRCVYRMDNDQPDHYITNLQFADQITVSFSMEALTSYSGRRTRIMGTAGDIVGDMSSLTTTDFRSGKQVVWSESTNDHGGGDFPMVADWVQAIARRDPTLLSSSIAQSIESHLMAFMAERSRHEGRVVEVKL
ncbi:MAG: Gfo/Idh/MocA family oxidoreductase [Nitrospira sp.]|nr:Gfo/Idh/MocA family oxidoreductase [Nitrospira sp.]